MSVFFSFLMPVPAACHMSCTAFVEGSKDAVGCSAHFATKGGVKIMHVCTVKAASC